MKTKANLPYYMNKLVFSILGHNIIILIYMIIQIYIEYLNEI